AAARAGLALPPPAPAGAFGGPGGPALTAPPVTVPGRGDPFAQSSRDYGALPIGGWVLYPTVFLGAVYDSNVNQNVTAKNSRWGGRIVPSLLAEATDGIHTSTLYGMADVRAYGDGTTVRDTTAARTGFIQRFQPVADLTFNAQGDYTRQRDLFSTFGIDHSVTTLNPTAVGLSPVPSPVAYNQFSGTASVQKMFDFAFVSFSGSVVDIVYDPGLDLGPGVLPLAAVASPNGATYTGTTRGGFWFTPYLYAYAEGSVDQRRYSTDQFNSSGYRTVGGI